MFSNIPDPINNLMPGPPMASVPDASAPMLSPVPTVEITPASNPSSPPSPIIPPSTSGKRACCDDDNSSTDGSAAEVASAIPPKIQRVEEEDSDDDTLTSVVKITGKKYRTYEVLIDRHLKDKEANPIEVEISNVTLRRNYPTLKRRECIWLNVDVRYENLNPSTFLKFISNFDPMRYLLLNAKKDKILMKPKNIWSLDRDEMRLKFNGVTFLRVQHIRDEPATNTILVLNYLRESLSILSGLPHGPNELAISNCEFSVKGFQNGWGEEVQKLVLYRVWGDFSLQTILDRFPNLEEFICFKYFPQVGPKNYTTPLHLDISRAFASLPNIRKLTLCCTELVIPEESLCQPTSVTELCLDRCYSFAAMKRICEVLPVIFSHLQKLVLVTGKISEGSLVVSSIINCVRKKISSVEWIMVEGMIWNERGMDDEEDADLLDFLKQITGKEVDYPEEFTMEKTDEGEWKGNVWNEQPEGQDEVGGESRKRKRDEIEMEWCNLDNFYDSVDTFGDYFLKDNFPKPIFWT